MILFKFELLTEDISIRRFSVPEVKAIKLAADEQLYFLTDSSITIETKTTRFDY